MTVAPPRPIRLLSSMNTEAPVRAASIAAYMPAPPDPMIRTSVETCVGSGIACALGSGGALRHLPLLRCGFHRLDHLRIGRAAAEVAGEIVFDALVVRIGVLVEQLFHHQHEAWRAEAALERAALDEGLLHRIERLARRETLDGGHLGAVDEVREIKTARHRATVDQHVAAAITRPPAACRPWRAARGIPPRH